MERRVAIVGAGAVGLSTAVQIQQLLPSLSVTVIADKFDTDTNSYGAAGIFDITVNKTSDGLPVSQINTYMRDSWSQYDYLAHSADAAAAGVQILSGFKFTSVPTSNDLFGDTVYCCQPMTEKQLKMFHNDKYKYGWFMTTLLVEPAKYLPYLLNRFRANGGRVVVKKLSSFEELVGQYDLVVNCTGLGSQQLLSDSQLVPIRGHLISVKAPWLKHFIFSGEDYLQYIIPGVDMVHIGGTRTSNNTDLKPRPEDAERFLQQAYRVMPALRGAPIVQEWVGLRPWRTCVRVESEVLTFPSGKLQVVHNYGHGGEGIGLSWGTGKHAATLVKDVLRSDKPFTSKL